MKSLLKIPQKAQYGLLLVGELAARHLDPRLRRSGSQPLSLEVVAEKADISKKFLEQIAGDLRKAGLIEGRRGSAGGYVLLKDPSTLTVAEVVGAVEGPAKLDLCSAHGEAEKTDGIWAKLQGQILTTLSNTTIADLYYAHSEDD